MGEFGSNPSLPLQDESLFGGLEQDVGEEQPGVRFEEPPSFLAPTNDSQALQTDSTWQVDGSNQSLGKKKIYLFVEKD